MKSLLLITLMSVSASVWAEPASELDQLQRDYEKRRTDSLRAVTWWYRAQLEALQRDSKSPETQAAVTRTLASVRETFWQDDQPELRRALLATTWLWRSVDDAEGVSMTFHADGTVVHIGMHGTWQITGPCEVTIVNEASQRFVLRFNASLSAYEADRSNVSGHSVASLRLRD